MTRICKKCGQEKPVEMFFKRHNRPSPEGRCKACRKVMMMAASRAHYMRNRAAVLERTRLRKQANLWRESGYAKRARDEVRPWYVREVANRINTSLEEAEFRLLQRRAAAFFQTQSITKIITSCKT